MAYGTYPKAEQKDALEGAAASRHRSLPLPTGGGLAALDLLLVNLAFFAAYWLRYKAGVGGEVADEFNVGLDVYLPLQAALSAVLMAVYALGRLYQRSPRRSLVEESTSLLGTTSIGMMLFLAVVFLTRGYAYSRGLFLMAWVLIFAFTLALRILLQILRAYLQSQGIGVKRVLVAGAEPLGKAVMHVLTTEPGLDYRLVGFIDGGGDDIGRFKSLGTLEDLAEVVDQHQIDEVIIALPSSRHNVVPSITEQCRQLNVGFKVVPDPYEMSLSRLDVEDLRGIPVIGMKEPSIQGANLLIKRGTDLLMSALFVVALSPLWAFIALLIKLDSPGPVYFTQTRIGKGGRLFKAMKFRSMREGAEGELPELMSRNEAFGLLFKIRDDPRITRVGRFLRRTSLDELPQLINVLRGEISLVGPRPPLPSEVEKYDSWHMKRLEVAPGMTGLWQVSGRSELPFDEMVMLDVYYIENWSLGLDFQILLRTIPAVLSGRGAF